MEWYDVTHATVTVEGNLDINLDEDRPPTYSGKEPLKNIARDLKVAGTDNVDVIFYQRYGFSFGKVSCIISLLDADGNQRLSKTFSFDNNSDSHTISYISRSTLSEVYDVLSPDNRFTLLIDVYRLEEKSIMYQNAVKLSFEQSSFSNYRLLKGSPLVKFLSEESAYFKRIKSEDTWESLYFDEREFITFKNIGKILVEINPLRFNSIKEIFEMYTIASKYEIPAVITACKCFLKLCRFDYTAEEYRAFANEYEILKNEINEMNQTDFNEEIKMYQGGVLLKKEIRNCLWYYRHPQKNDLLYFENVKAPLKKYILFRELQEVEEFDFYT